MTDLTRPVAPDPYALLPVVPSFVLRSDDFRDGERVPDVHSATAVGSSVSPHLAWSGFPAQTRSFLVSCFDPDAPGPAGWWHWNLLDVPVTTTELAQGVGTLDGADLPPGSFQLRGDDGVAAYQGAAPPPGDQVHRYFYVVHALDVPSLGLDRDTLPGKTGAVAVFHTLARAVLVGTYQT